MKSVLACLSEIWSCVSLFTRVMTIQKLFLDLSLSFVQKRKLLNHVLLWQRICQSCPAMTTQPFLLRLQGTIILIVGFNKSYPSLWYSNKLSGLFYLSLIVVENRLDLPKYITCDNSITNTSLTLSSDP